MVGRTDISMSDRQNTIVCIFDPRSPRISAFNIHEWIHNKMRLEEDDIRMLQIDGPHRRVYLKFTSEERLKEVMSGTNGQLEYRHESGELSQVRIEIAGLGIRKIRVAGLPPEVQDHIVKEHFSKYGDILSIRDDVWTAAYRYKVSNGIRIVEVNLKRHIPSHLAIAGNEILISYEGQPQTCYRCNETGHQQINCPRRQRVNATPNTQRQTWADIVANTPHEAQTVGAQISPVFTTMTRQENASTKTSNEMLTNTQVETQGLQEAGNTMGVAELQTGLGSLNSCQHTPDRQEAEERRGPILMEHLDINVIDNPLPRIEQSTATTVTTFDNTGDRETQHVIIDYKASSIGHRQSIDTNSEEDIQKDEVSTRTLTGSSSRPKKLKTDRDDSSLRNRKRSKSRNKTLASKD